MDYSRYTNVSPYDPMAAPAGNNEESEEDDYDPSNFVAGAADSEPSSTNATPTMESAEADNGSAQPVNAPAQEQNPNTNGAVKQPRTVGGFIVDDEDDEEEANGLNGSLSTAGTTQVAQAADNTFSTSEQSMSEKATQDTSVAAPAHSTVAAAQPISTSSLRSPVAASNPSGSGTSLNMSSQSSAPVSKTRLPQDRVGILEDRIAEDPRGDIDAWLSLIADYRGKNKFDDARKVYERFFQVFPSAAEQWVAYATMELERDEFYRLEQIFNKTLMSIPNVQLWSLYLDYIRRRNNLITDTSGNARKVVTQAYEFVLQNIGIDKDSGFIWQEYLKFLKSGPGTVGGSTWQDGQKMDSLRKAYQNAIRLPTQSVNPLWTEYTTFETTLNKTTGRQLLAQQSQNFMTAKQQYVALNTITSKIVRTTIPRLPPLPGFEGYDEFVRQVDLWKQWIQFEKDDPLVLRDSDKKEEKEEYKKRVIYAYKQAFMALRFVPEIWYDAAEFCSANDMEKEGDEFLAKGIEANPESCLLAFKRADRLELASVSESDPIKRGATVRAPYNTVLDALYELRKHVEARGQKSIMQIQASFADQPQDTEQNDDDDEDDQARSNAAKARKEAMDAQVQAAQADINAQIELVKKSITAAWIALMRAMRRVQGKGKQGDPVGGMRQIFGDARKRGQLTPDFYIESGLLEHVAYQDPAGTKILERGLKLYPEDENIALAYIKHLIGKHDTTNARATFETVVNKLISKPENQLKAKPLFLYFHEYESKYGELAQVNKLETRMAALYPDDPKLQLFAHRFKSIDAHDKTFDPTTVQHIISPATQARVKASVPEVTSQQAVPSIEASAVNSPRPEAALTYSNSPKRPYQPEESDTDLYPPRKFIRGESPLKGAAGRRLAAARQGTPNAAPDYLTKLDWVIRLLPTSAASQHIASRISSDKLVAIMRGVDTSRPPPTTLGVQPPVPPALAAVQPPLQSPSQRPGSGSWSQPTAPTPQTYAQPYGMPPPVPPSQPPTAANSYGVSPPLPVQTGQYPPQPPSVGSYSSYPPPQYNQPQQPPAQYQYPGVTAVPPPPPQGWQQPPPSASGYPPQNYQGYR